MRIIAGSRRGHKLFEFPGEDIRPTTDRVKESIFNLIGSRVVGARVLDAFGGSGALGFEAISRGAAFATIVEKNTIAADIIRRNCVALRFGQFVHIVNSEATRYLSTCKEKFNLVLLDPPYNHGFVKPVMMALNSRMLLENGAMVVVESDTTDIPSAAEGYTIIKQRKYGRTYITVYIKD